MNLLYQRKDECVVHYNGPSLEGIERGKPVPLSSIDIGQFEETFVISSYVRAVKLTG